MQISLWPCTLFLGALVLAVSHAGRAAELAFLGSLHTHDVRQEAALALAGTEPPVRVNPSVRRVGASPTQPWWREPNTVLLERPLSDADPVIRGESRAVMLLRAYLPAGAELHPGVDRVLGTRRALMDLIAREPGALGLLDFPSALQHVESVPLAANAQDESVAASVESIRSGRYPLAGCLYLYLERPAGDVRAEQQALIDYLLGEAGQQMLTRNGYVALPQEVAQQTRHSLRVGTDEAPAAARCSAAPAQRPSVGATLAGRL